MTRGKILIIGANGQVGKELVEDLRKKHGADQVVATDVREEKDVSGLFEKLDVLDNKALFSVVKKHNVKEVYHLAAMLSANAEDNPGFAWKLNMEGLFNVLDLAKEKHISKLFWPSSIAVFGPTSPKAFTPQSTIIEPNTVYGISKLAGERWCEYYHKKFGVDVRSIRYPGLMGYKSQPGGGTTDYAVHIFHAAIRDGSYECFLDKNTRLPMMYMPDAARATIEIMEAKKSSVKIRSSYNVAGMSFSPAELALHIKKQIPGFKITCKPDYRQKIAENWPGSIDDTPARTDWGWKPTYSVDTMVKDMIKNIKSCTFSSV